MIETVPFNSRIPRNIDLDCHLCGIPWLSCPCASDWRLKCGWCWLLWNDCSCTCIHCERRRPVCYRDMCPERMQPAQRARFTEYDPGLVQGDVARIKKFYPGTHYRVLGLKFEAHHKARTWAKKQGYKPGRLEVIDARFPYS